MKRICALILVFALAFLMLPMQRQVYAASNVWDGTVSTRFAGGSGTSSNPYRIETGAQLAYLAQSVNSDKSTFVYQDTYFSLASDIDLNGQNWTPIGNDAHYFCGNFAGNGHTISNLFINQPAGNNIGLFGRVYKAKISSVHLENAAVRGVENVGGLIGYMSGSGVSLTKCSVDGIVHGSEKTGGLVGNSGGSISDCTNFATVNGSKYTGGISGWASSATITRCLNYGTIKASDFECGGIAGYSGTIADCFNSGPVSGTSDVGGIAGDADSLTNCGNIGSVSGTRNVGGLWGDMVSGAASYCYNAGSVSGSNSGALGGWTQSSVISDNYYQIGSSSSILGYSASGSYANTMSNNQSVLNCATQSFANTLNGNLSVFDTQWTYDPTQYGGYPYIELRTVTKIQVSGENNLILYEGDTFDGTGLTINVAYDDGSKSTVSPSACIYSPNGPLSAGLQTISVTYGGKSTTIRVQVRSQSEYAETDWINCDTLRVSVTDVATGTTAIGAAYDKTGRLLETHVSSVNENGAVFFSFDEVKETALAKVFYVDSKYRPIRSDAQVSHTVGTGHVVVTNPAEAATCTMPGHTEGSYCSVCGKVLSEQVAIPALGHNFVDHVCTRCGASDGAIDEVSAITLNTTSLNLAEGDSSKLVATVYPSNALGASISWTSSNTAVATVDIEGTVTAVSAGNAIITASAGSKSAICIVTVTEGASGNNDAYGWLANYITQKGTRSGNDITYSWNLAGDNNTTEYLTYDTFEDEITISTTYNDGSSITTSEIVIPATMKKPYCSYYSERLSGVSSSGTMYINPQIFGTDADENCLSFVSYSGSSSNRSSCFNLHITALKTAIIYLDQDVFSTSPYSVVDLGFERITASTSDTSSYASAARSLRSYILTNGSIASSETGSRKLTRTTTSDGYTYTAEIYAYPDSSNIIGFYYKIEKGTSSWRIGFRYYIDGHSTGPSLNYTELGMYSPILGRGLFDASSYSSGDEIEWIADEGVSSSTFEDHKVLMNAGLQRALYDFNYLMLNSAGVSLKDMGFISY